MEEAQSFYEENKYKIPEGAKAALGVAERQAGGLRLPGEDILRSRAAEATSGALGASQQAATSSSDILNTLGDVYGRQQEREQDILLQGVNRYDRNQTALRGELGRMAGFEETKWKYTGLMPYQQMLGQAQMISERGAGGLSGGLGAAGETAAMQSQAAGAQSSYQNYLADLGVTKGDINPQNRLERMESLPPSVTSTSTLDTKTLAGG